MIRSTTYKGVFAIEIVGGNATAVFLPGEGGKLASFKSEGTEYLVQNPSPDYLHLGENSDYVKTECAGFDDTFPTIDPCVGINGKRYPDHGEVCRESLSYEIRGETLIMRLASEKFGYKYEKRVTARPDGVFEIAYEAENLNDVPLPCIFAAHCLVNAENGGEILVPFNINDKTELFFDVTETFPAGASERLLVKEMLRFPDNAEEKRCFKLYFPALKDSYALGFRPKGKDALMIKADGLPFAGIWVNDGYLNGMRCVGLEPCSARYDSPETAAKKGESVYLASHKKMRFKIYLYTNDSDRKDI